MTTDCPNGFLKYGFIVFGKGLDPFVPTVVSKGFVVECPDRANASDQFNIDFHGQVRRLLQTLGGNYRMQLCWSVDSNYKDELAEYGHETQNACTAEYPRQIRTATFLKFHDAMERRELRREHLHLFISKKIVSTPSLFISSRHRINFYKKLFEEYQREFELLQTALSNLFAPSNVRFTPLDDDGHFRQGFSYLNPAYATTKGHDPMPAFIRDNSLQEHWFGSGLETGGEHLPSFGFKSHGLFWNLLTLRRLPDGTDPKSILLLTQTDLLDYSITVNLYPSDKDKVVSREQEKLRRVRGDYASTRDPEFLEAMTMIEERIKSLKRGSVNPYDADFIIRIWASTPEELADKTQILRTVINRLDGCKEHEPLTFSTNKQLWFQSWPGWIFGKYTHHAKYFEDINLASMLPFSSTFTGHLRGAEILHAGANRSVVGIKTNIEGQPQHCLFLGMTGSGKTTLLETFLGQGHHRYAYTFIVEEGFGYTPFAKALGYRPKVIRPDGEDTLNYLDTRGLPLAKSQKSEAAALCAYMVGTSADEDRQRMRLALFARYIDQLYTDTFEDWARSRPDELIRIAREALAVSRWHRAMEAGSSFLDAWVDFHQEANAERWQEVLHAATDEEVIQFLKTPATEEIVRNCVFAHFTPEQMPTHSVLVEMMRRTPMPEHDRRTVQDLAEQLADWSRDEGSKGKLFDGVTNISLTDELTLIELSLLGSGESPMKTAAYYLISNACRKHIMTLPRHLLKRGLIEEAARVADIPNGAAMMEEMAAQLRKYNCWACFAFQNDAQLEKEKVRKVVFGNIKQALLGRQRSPKLVQSIAQELELPEAAAEAIARYPLPEHIGYAYSQFLYYHMDATRPLCGTITVTKNPPPEAPKEKALAAPSETSL
jgi:energy-coupling factor transporter ATP-binding protein EcfA2